MATTPTPAPKPTATTNVPSSNNPPAQTASDPKTKEEAKTSTPAPAKADQDKAKADLAKTAESAKPDDKSVKPGTDSPKPSADTQKVLDDKAKAKDQESKPKEEQLTNRGQAFEGSGDIPRVQTMSAAYGMDWSRLWGLIQKLGPAVKEVIMIIMEEFRDNPILASSRGGQHELRQEDVAEVASKRKLDPTELLQTMQQLPPTVSQLVLAVLKSDKLNK